MLRATFAARLGKSEGPALRMQTDRSAGQQRLVPGGLSCKLFCLTCHLGKVGEMEGFALSHWCAGRTRGSYPDAVTVLELTSESTTVLAPAMAHTHPT